MKTAILMILTILAAVMVAAGPDLTVSSMELSDLREEVEGVQTALILHIANNGNATAGISHYALDITGETSRTIIVPPIPAGAEVVDTVTITFSSTGAKDINITLDSRAVIAEDDETNNVATITTSIASANPKIEFASTAALALTATQGNTSVKGTVTVKNTGNTDMNDVEMTITNLEDGSKDISGSSVTIEPSKFNLLQGESKEVKITVPLDESQPVDKYTGTLKAKSGAVEVSKSVSVDVKKAPTDSMLVIDKVKIAVGQDAEDDSFSTLSYGEEETIAPEDEIKFEVYLENKDNDLDMDRINVLVEIEGDDWDDDDEQDHDDLDSGDNSDDPLEFSFTVDEEVQDGDEYDVTITVEGRDEDGNVHRDVFSATLKVEQKSDDLRLKLFEADNTNIGCAGSTKLTLKVENKGTSRQKDAYVTLKSTELGIDTTLSGMDIDKSGDSDDEVSKSVNINLKEGLTGTHSIMATVYNDDGDKMDTGVVSLNFNCKEDSTSGSGSTNTNTGSTNVDKTQDNELPSYNSTDVADTVEEDFRGSNAYMIIIIILAVVVIGLGIALLVKIW